MAEGRRGGGRQRSVAAARAESSEGDLARVAFDAQTALGETEPTEKWVALRPNKFNGKAKNCWRLDLDFN